MAELGQDTLLEFKEEKEQYNSYLQSQMMSTQQDTQQIINNYTSGPQHAQQMNYSDTEEEIPASENMDQCHMFDNDIEKMPLFQPRGTQGTEPLYQRQQMQFLLNDNDHQEQQVDKQSISKISTFSLTSNNSSVLSLRLLGKPTGLEHNNSSFRQHSKHHKKSFVIKPRLCSGYNLSFNEPSQDAKKQELNESKTSALNRSFDQETEQALIENVDFIHER